jgi:hypothetical protein
MDYINRYDPYGDDNDAIEAFTDRQLIDRPFLLRKHITGRATPDSVKWLDIMADRAHDPELLRTWMRLALAGDANGLLTAVARWTEYWVDSDTDDWIVEQVYTGNWIAIERDEAQGD